MAASSPPKRARDGDGDAPAEPSSAAAAGDARADGRGDGDLEQKRAKQLCFAARKSAPGAAQTVEVCLAGSATVAELAAQLAAHEGCEPARVTIVHRGAVLSQGSMQLLYVAEKEGGSTGKVAVVYLVRKAAAAPAPAAAAAPAGEAAAGAVAGAAAAQAEPPPPAAAPPAETAGQRVLLLIRHGQCCHEDEGDELKSLTDHGQRQAEDSALYVAGLFAAGKVPEQRALLHSTSRRARETAAKLPRHLPGIDVWNADILRETNPTANPLRAEEVFNRLFAAPPAGADDTLIVVAHNNIILYLLMRAAGVPFDRAAQAWRLFHLRHASVTRIDVSSAGSKTIVSIGSAGHIPHANVTWNNITGADMSAWKGGKPERHKFSGRMVILVRQAASAGAPQEAAGAAAGGAAASRGVGALDAGSQAEAVAAHIKGLSEYMVSGHLTVTCTTSAQPTASAIAQRFRTSPQILPDSITEHPEAAFLQFFSPPAEHGRETVAMVAEDGPVIYWLLRALQLGPEEAKAATGSYRIGHASLTLVNVRTDGSMKVVAVGDTGHLPAAAT